MPETASELSREVTRGDIGPRGLVTFFSGTREAWNGVGRKRWPHRTLGIWRDRGQRRSGSLVCLPPGSVKRGQEGVE